MGHDFELIDPTEQHDDLFGGHLWVAMICRKQRKKVGRPYNGLTNR